MVTTDRVSDDNRVLRVVLPLDTAASAVFVLLALVAVPALALLDVPADVVSLVGLAFVVYALALAAMGVVTAWTLISSMARGRYDLPARLWLPLPRAAQPFPGGRTDTTAGHRGPRPAPGSDRSVPDETPRQLDQGAVRP
jgi:hypothetical protein